MAWFLGQDTEGGVLTDAPRRVRLTINTHNIYREMKFSQMRKVCGLLTTGECRYGEGKTQGNCQDVQYYKKKTINNETTPPPSQ